jgi:hypothetical protein
LIACSATSAFSELITSSCRQIFKERQIEFDADSDPEFLYELFGEDSESLAEFVLVCVL